MKTATLTVSEHIFRELAATYPRAHVLITPTTSSVTIDGVLFVAARAGAA